MKLPSFKLSYGKKLAPARDWIVLVIVTIVGIAASLGWNLWLFNHVANGAVLGAAPVSAPTGFNQATLEALTKFFSKRASEEEKYRNGGYLFVDPS